MTNTITGSDLLGVVLSTPVLVASNGIVENIGQLAPVTDGSAAGTLTNYGLVSSAATAVYLNKGGTVNNRAGGTISGFTALDILQNAAIDNAGMIDGFGLGIGFNGGNITNELGGLIEGGITGGTGLITNAGTIEKALGPIIDLTAGGFVSNIGTAAQLTGGNALGILIAGGGGDVVNQGAIDGISLQAGGLVSNQGYIGLGTALYGVGISGGNPGSVYNKGSIVGVGLFSGGVITNQTAGIISGNYTGIKLSVGGTVSNTGTILGVGGLAGELAPGKLGGAGVFLASGNGAITNSSHALILGTKYGLELSGTQPGDLVMNYGLIAGRVGIRDIGPTNNTIVDFGTITGTGGVAVEFGAGNDLLYMEPGSTLNGKVAGGSGHGIVEFNEGTSGNSISWLNNAFVNNVTFINETPTLNLSGANQLVPGEILSNAGLLISNAGLDIFGTLTNTGTLGGTITLGGTFSNPFIDTSPAQLFNKAGAVISSSFATAIRAVPGTQGGTIENAGTIADTAQSGVAISLTGGQNDLLIVDPGSKIIGQVNGGGGGAVLQLGAGAAAGSIASFSSQYVNFTTVSVATGATWDISSATINNLINNGTIVLDPTTMTVNGPLTGTGVTEIDTGSLLIVNAPVASTQTIAFTGTDGTLALDDPAAFSGTVLGFVDSQTIDLAGLAYNANGLVLYAAGNALEIIEDNTFALIHIAAAQTLTHEYFHLSSDGLRGTDIIENSVPCFLRGTLIRTKAGDIAVEDLKIGDLILGADGPEKAVKWIGRRRYAAPLPDNPDIIPVQIKAGALAENVPAQDLYLSPLHAVGVDGFLVPAGALLNGVSVVEQTDMTEIEYFHIETDQHDMIIANGAPAETFIDDNSRKMFDNADEYARLYPHGQALSHVLCVPRLEFGPMLESIRRKIALRAGVLPEQSHDSEIIGFLENADRSTITGWAYAPARPNLPLSLEIFNRGALLARTIANIPRPDVKIAGFGNGRCGFSITLPAPLPALQRHEISVRPAGATQYLPGSPAVLDPGIAHDLLKTGGLQTLIEAAVKGLGSPDEVAVLGDSLEAAGKQIKLQATAPRAAMSAGVAAKQKTVLVLDEAWPTPTLDAGSNAVISHITGFLRLGHQVVFCATAGAPRSAAAFAGLAALQALGVECHGQEGATAEETIRALAVRDTQAVYLHRLGTAAAYGGLARQYAPTARIIFSIADLHHLRLARQAEVTGRPDLAAQARAVKATEIWAMQLANCVITHSRFEADYLRREIPRVNVDIVPWAVPVSAPPHSRRNRAHIAFIGGAGHAPNLDAVTHLARDIMPLVWRRAPEMKCLVIGDGWPVNLFETFDPRMVSLGHQPDLGPLLASVRLTVAPLRFGAGVKGKVLVSMAAGTPCVMSTVAAEGLPLDAHLRALTGDGDALVDNILALYRDKKLNRVAVQSGLDMIQTSFTQDEVDDALARVLGIAQPGKLAESSKATAALHPV